MTFRGMYTFLMDSGEIIPLVSVAYNIKTEYLSNPLRTDRYPVI